MKSIPTANLARFLEEDDQKPVVMLNLLRFNKTNGRTRYYEYISRAAPIAQSYGAEIIYSGEGLTALAAEAGQTWDAAVLVRYPGRQAFAAMISDPRYSEIDSIRIAALDEAVLQPLS